MTRREVVVSLLQQEACPEKMQKKVLRTYITRDRPDSLRTSLDAMPLKDALRLGLVIPVLTTPHKKLEERELNKALSELLKTLTPRQEFVIKMIYYHGLKPAEVGAELQVTSKAISGIKLRALYKLRSQTAVQPLKSFLVH